MDLQIQLKICFHFCYHVQSPDGPVISYTLHQFNDFLSATVDGKDNQEILVDPSNNTDAHERMSTSCKSIRVATVGGIVFNKYPQISSCAHVFCCVPPASQPVVSDVSVTECFVTFLDNIALSRRACCDRRATDRHDRRAAACKAAGRVAGSAGATWSGQLCPEII